jgi:hypothetical protein
LFLASHLRRSGSTVVWPSNDRIARCTGLSLRAVERGIAYLRAIKKITVSHALRPASRAMPRRKVGRIIELHLTDEGGPNPIVRFPSPRTMAWVWRSCRAVRSRPAALVAVAVAELVIAAAELGDDLTEAAFVGAPIEMIRSLVGAPHGGAFNRRLDDLERAGVLDRAGSHWRSGAIVQLPPRPAARPLPTPLPQLLPAPMQRVGHFPAANDGPTIEEIDKINAEVAAALRWRGGSEARPARGSASGATSA